MRHLKVAVLLLLVFALPLAGDDDPPIDIVDPDNGESGCVECAQSMGEIVCGGEPTGAGWVECEGGWIDLCDGSGACDRVPNCGSRCAIA